MNRPDPKDPNDWLYAACSMIIAAIILLTSVIALGYLIVMAPSHAHELNEGEDAEGYGPTIICTIIFVVCLALIIRDLVRRMRGCPRGEMAQRYMGTSMGHASVLFGLMMIMTLIAIGAVYLFGQEVTEDFIDKMTDYQNIASMMEAGPTEEILFRLGLIGIPMLIICAFMHRARLKDIMGGFGMSKIALIPLLISAILFGLAHIEGWSIMKFPDTFISGLIFGYVYIEHGLHVTIVAHSAFDILSSLSIIFGETACNVLMVAVMVLGAVLLVRSLIGYRRYIPENKIQEPFDGTLLEMWERD